MSAHRSHWPLLAGLSLAAMTAAAMEAEGPYEQIEFSPVAVTWQYSRDGGVTFADRPHPAPPPGVSVDRKVPDTRAYAYVWRGSFEVADPAAVAGLWVRIFEEPTGEGMPRAAICNGDLVAAGAGNWKNLGYCPTLLDAVVTLNGEPVPMAHGPVLLFWVPLLGELRQGVNTVELRGHVYTYWGAGGGQNPVEALDARLIQARAQPAAIYNGPVLGDFGDDYFTLACRTQLPADLVVEATPMDPAGAPVTVVSQRSHWHRVRVELPAGTREVAYTVTARVGPHETVRGPYHVTLPGARYRFAAFGNPQQKIADPDLRREPWAVNAAQILSARPDFAVSTGNHVEQGSWAFRWEAAYTGPAADLLARVPMLVTPCNRDFAGSFNELHYTPAPGGYGHSWTKVIGPVRFIGIDGHHDWSAGGQNARWLEEVLQQADDPFIVVLCGYPGYSGGINSREARGALRISREVIMPLLGRYNATLMLSSWDPAYERIEPTPDLGVTQIVTGHIGRKSFHRWSTHFGSHPFVPGPQANARSTQGPVTRPDGGEWVGFVNTPHFCWFEVGEDALELTVLRCAPTAEAGTESLTVLDRKTFQPRR